MSSTRFSMIDSTVISPTRSSRPISRRSSRARKRPGSSACWSSSRRATQKEAAQAARVERLWPEARFAIGVHPHQAHQFADDPEQRGGRRARAVCSRRPPRAPSARSASTITTTSRRATCSRRCFARRSGSPASCTRPVVIHTREADDDTLAILREEGGGEVRGVLHCFTGDCRAGARRARPRLLHLARRHRHVSEGGRAARHGSAPCPIDRLLTETDSPFLAPVPHRGKRNEPAHVVRVVAALAELRGVDAGELARRTARISTRCFGREQVTPVRLSRTTTYARFTGGWFPP